MKTVFSKVTVDKQINNDTATKGYGQAEDVYKRGGFIFVQITQGNFYVIFQHRETPEAVQ